MENLTSFFETEAEKAEYSESTYEIVSQIAYLIGVPKRIFENSHEPPKITIYHELNFNKNARIIRNLCIIRTAIERNFKAIHDKMRSEYRSILSLPEYVPQSSITQLNEDGVNFIKKNNTRLSMHIVEINRIISDRINNCKDIFPLWINWNYIRNIFIMPNGVTENGTREAAELYYANMSCYPYQMYINWEPQDAGNILYNDKKFVSLLYRWNGDWFMDDSKVSDVSDTVKDNIYDFLENSGKAVVVVDCENSDPYSLYAVLNNLNPDFLAKISRIILFDDSHTASAWRILDRFTEVPVEHMEIERVKQSKSLVDIKLTARACQEHFQNQVDSFVIVSSDSDYWGLISSLPNARFLVMVERDKCGPDIKKALEDSHIFYCYIDDFYSAKSEDIKMTALFQALRSYLNDALHLNVNTMLDEVLAVTRVEMSSSERKQFYDKHIRGMGLNIDENGDVSIELKKF